MIGHTSLRLSRLTGHRFQFSDATGVLAVSESAVRKNTADPPSIWRGFCAFFAPKPKPSVIVRNNSAYGEPLFRLRQSSGLMYDSRRVYDGSGQLLAHIRSDFKSALGGHASLIDMRGVDEECPDISGCPWFGIVRTSEGQTTVKFVGHTSASGIAVSTLLGKEFVTIWIEEEIAADPVRAVLVWAVALMMVWKPPS